MYIRVKRIAVGSSNKKKENQVITGRIAQTSVPTFNTAFSRQKWMGAKEGFRTQWWTGKVWSTAIPKFTYRLTVPK